MLLYVYYLFIFIELADYFISLPELYGSGNDDAAAATTLPQYIITLTYTYNIKQKKKRQEEKAKIK